MRTSRRSGIAGRGFSFRYGENDRRSRGKNPRGEKSKYIILPHHVVTTRNLEHAVNFKDRTLHSVALSLKRHSKISSFASLKTHLHCACRRGPFSLLRHVVCLRTVCQKLSIGRERNLVVVAHGTEGSHNFQSVWTRHRLYWVKCLCVVDLDGLPVPVANRNFFAIVCCVVILRAEAHKTGYHVYTMMAEAARRSRLSYSRCFSMSQCP